MTYAKYASYRDDRGLKDADVSKETGITRSMFSDWKKERYTPKLDKLLKIARLFGVPLEEFIGSVSEG